MQTKSIVAVAGGLVLTGLTACGGGQAAPPVAPPPPPAPPVSSAPASSAPASTAKPSATTANPSATPSSSGGGGSAADRSKLTPDGTKLKFGESGTVLFEYTKKETVVSVKGVKIEKGTKEDLAKFKIDDAALKQATPFYVTMEYAYQSGEVLKSPHLNVKLKGQDASGASLSHVILIGKFEKCDDQKAKEFGQGATQTECRVFMAPPGSELTQVTWSPDYKSKGITFTK